MLDLRAAHFTQQIVRNVPVVMLFSHICHNPSIGFGPAFKHPTGHGVGFAAINHNARPRVHPRSDDVLENGMVLNIEPAAYVEQFGMRHCDMIAVTDDGAELLTDFHNAADELTLSTAHASTDEP